MKAGLGSWTSRRGAKMRANKKPPHALYGIRIQKEEEKNMGFNSKVDKQRITPAGSYVFTDDLHDIPFKNLTASIKPEGSVTYTYNVKIGGASVSSGSALAGVMTIYNNTGILPANQPNANWNKGSDGGYFLNDSTNVGWPITVEVTNTGATAEMFIVSISSEVVRMVR